MCSCLNRQAGVVCLSHTTCLFHGSRKVNPGQFFWEVRKGVSFYTGPDAHVEYLIDQECQINDFFLTKIIWHPSSVDDMVSQQALYYQILNPRSAPSNAQQQLVTFSHYGL